MNRLHAVLLLVLLSLLAACAATRQARSVKPSGFMGADADLLKRRGGENVAGGPDWLLSYDNPNADFASYDKILLDPVTLWHAPGDKLGISQADAQKVANNFYRLLEQSLSKDYQMVTEPQPGAIRAKLALSRVSKADATLNVVTTVIPQLRAVTALEGYAAGKPLFTGEVDVEGKLVDASSGELLAASVDKRVGEKQLVDAFNSWAAVNESLEYWAELLRYRLCRLREGTGCVKPKVKRGF